MRGPADRGPSRGEPAEVRIQVRLTPRGGADRVDGARDGTLLVRVSAPPADGAANEALLRLIAGELGVARGAVRLRGGGKGRNKLVVVAGVARTLVAARWPDLGV